MAELSYNMIAPPFAVDFKESDKQLLRQYFDWFVAEIPSRLRELQRAIDSTGGPAFQLDFSRESLLALGQWFAPLVETRELSRAEISAWKASLPYYIDAPTSDLTDRTKSLCVDIGIYEAETLRHHFPFLKWELRTKNKRHAEYGRPVLSGFLKSMEFDPAGFVLGDKLSEDPTRTHEIARTFDVWSEYARAAQIQRSSL
jgi:hypothetical protein